MGLNPKPEICFHLIYNLPKDKNGCAKECEQPVDIAVIPGKSSGANEMLTLTRRASFESFVKLLPSRSVRKKYRKLRSPYQAQGVQLLKKALKWKNDLDKGHIKSRSEIAHQEGITRARVTQIMSMLRLTSEIQKNLLSSSNEGKVRYIAERSLRSITGLESQKQLEAFRAMFSEALSKATQVTA